MRHRNPAKTAIAATSALNAEMFIQVLNQSKSGLRLRCNGLPTDDLIVNKRMETSAYGCQTQVCVISWLH